MDGAAAFAHENVAAGRLEPGFLARALYLNRSARRETPYRSTDISEANLAASGLCRHIRADPVHLYEPATGFCLDCALDVINLDISADGIDRHELKIASGTEFHLGSDCGSGTL